MNAGIISEYFIHVLKYLQGNILSCRRAVSTNWVHLRPPHPRVNVLVQAFPLHVLLIRQTQQIILLPTQKWEHGASDSTGKEKVNNYQTPAVHKALVIGVLSAFFPLILKIPVWGKYTNFHFADDGTATLRGWEFYLIPLHCITSSVHQTVYIKPEQVAMAALRNLVLPWPGSQRLWQWKVATFSSSELSEVTGQPHCLRPCAETVKDTGLPSQTGLGVSWLRDPRAVLAFITSHIHSMSIYWALYMCQAFF